MSEREREAQFRSLRAHVELMAYGSRASWLYEEEGLYGSISPQAGDQGMANIAVCHDSVDPLIALAGYHWCYEYAGVRTSMVWDSRQHNPAILSSMGYRLNGHFPAISIDLTDLPDIDVGEFEYKEIGDLGLVGEVNAELWGAGLEKVLVSTRAIPYAKDLHIYFAPWGDGVGAVLLMLDQKDLEDVTGMWLATHPAAKGHQLGQRLYLSALRAARDRGMRTASGQASPKAAAIYEGWGFKRVDKTLWDVYERKVSASADQVGKGNSDE